MKKKIKVFLPVMLAVIIVATGCSANRPKSGSEISIDADISINADTDTSADNGDDADRDTKTDQQIVAEQQTFYATITSISQDTLVVQGSAQNDINFRGRFQFIVSADTRLEWRYTEIELSDLKVGNNISITFSGEIMEISPAVIRDVNKIQLLDDEIGEGQEIQDDRDPANAEAENASVKAAYISVLEGIFNEQSFPDGIDRGFGEYSDISANHFAVYDIDQDGSDELIVVYISTSMAGMSFLIYDYSAEAGGVREQFSEFPALTFYDNGVVEAEWSHNQGLAGNFWPYTLYQYDRIADTYQQIAMVDAWDSNLAEVNYKGTPFPIEADADGDGMVYYVMPGESYEHVNPIDFEEYSKWREQYLGGSEKIEIPYVNLTRENIEQISNH